MSNHINLIQNKFNFKSVFLITKALFLYFCMSKLHFSKQLLSIFIDFLFLLIIFCFCIFAFLTAKAILYPSEKAISSIIISTESMPVKFSNSIREGDTVYDTLTKRKIGEIKSIEKAYTADRVSFTIKINARSEPKSEALRTSSLWFRYTVREVEEHQ